VRQLPDRDGQHQRNIHRPVARRYNTTNFIVYYVNTADQKFRRATNAKGSTRVLAGSVTNITDLFRAQDYAGNVLTNIQNNTVLHAKLEFYQTPRFGVLPDYYKLETSTTRR
jgi:hypothetical protein